MKEMTLGPRVVREGERERERDRERKRGKGDLGALRGPSCQQFWRIPIGYSYCTTAVVPQLEWAAGVAQEEAQSNAILKPDLASKLPEPQQQRGRRSEWPRLAARSSASHCSARSNMLVPSTKANGDKG